MPGQEPGFARRLSARPHLGPESVRSGDTAPRLADCRVAGEPPRRWHRSKRACPATSDVAVFLGR